ncbi:hypothetical protein ABBQ38_006860 [Trebouxia sp. C0009 RCD-2024]
MPQDIRSFFGSGAKTASKQADSGKGVKRSAPAKDDTNVEDLTKDDDEPLPVKRSKHFAAKDAVAPKAAKVASASTVSKRKSPAKPASTSGATTLPARKTAQKPASKAKKAIVLDSDSDDGDDDFQMPDAAAATPAEPEDSDFELDVDDDDDVPLAKKKQKSASGKASAAKPDTKKSSVPAPATTSKAPGSAAKAARKMPDQLAAKTEPAAKPVTARKATPAKGKAAKAAAEAEDPETAAALQKVTEAIAKLPKEPAHFSLMEKQEGGGYVQGGDSVPPPQHGSKDKPMGHHNCLKGKTFVITGTLDSLYRGEAEDYIKRHSGRVTGSVSGKTDFLVVGENSGNSKVHQAQEKGTRLIDEDGLFSLVAAAPEAGPAAASPATKPSELRPGSFYGGKASTGTGDQARKAALASSSLAASGARSAGASAGPSSSGRGAFRGGAGASAGGQLWVEKHKPNTSSELVGNNALVATLRTFLSDWDKVHLRHEKPAEVKGRGGGKPKDLSKKAVLLSGPPGIGKTSSATIISRELGFTPVEVNASDTRNKADASALKGVAAKLANSIKELATNTAIGLGTDHKPKRICLIMDEVDGMSGGDRGGVNDLIQSIHRSKVPIICICNDKYNQKLRSLRNHTLELDYRKPTKLQISKRMLQICHKEGLQVNESTLEALVEGSNSDIRLILGQLQMVRLSSKALTYDEVKSKMGSGKDFEMSPFEAARKLLSMEAQHLSLGSQSDLIFQDMDLVPLLIQENYLNHRPVIATNDQIRMQVIAKAADAFSAGDIVNKRVRQFQIWSLMPFAAVVGSVFPAAYMRGSRETFGLFPGEMNFPRFTAWMGSNSSQGKQRRMLGELHTRMLSSGNMHSDRTSLRLQYIPTLRQTLTAPLALLEKEGIQPIMDQMHAYCIARDDLDYVLDVTKWKTKSSWGEDPMKAVPTQVKSAFTREFNKNLVKPRTNTEVEAFKRKKKGKKAPAGDDAMEDPVDPEMEPDTAQQETQESAQGQEEEEDEDETDPVLLAKKQKQLAKRGVTFEAKVDPKAKKKGGSKTTGASTSKAGGASSGRGRASGGKAGGGRGAGRGRGK